MIKAVKILFFVVIIAFTGCREVGLRLGEGGRVLARVGEQELLLSDVKGVFTAGISEQDSLKLLESYVDMWVRKQVKITEAETRFSADEADISRMVDDYRNSLLSNKLDQYWIESGVSSDISDSEVASYYESHTNDFLLDRTIVKGTIAVVPASFSGRSKLKSLMGGSASERADFKAIAEKSGIQLYEYDSWTDESVLLSRLTATGQDDSAQLLSQRGVTEIREGNSYYLIYISDRRNQGDISPQERVSDLIIRILYNQRTGDVVRSREDSLITVAKLGKKLEINIK